MYNLLNPDPNEEVTLRVLSLGAGVQSTAMVLMAIEGELTPRPDCAIFADTGWEPQSVYDHLDWLQAYAKERNFTIYRVAHGNLMQDTLDAVAGKRKRVANPPFFTASEKTGKEGRLMRQCTQDYKIHPVMAKIRELLGVAKGRKVPKGVLVEQWMGISMDEIQRMKPSQKKYVRLRYPLIEKYITRMKCLDWMKERGFPEPTKSACIACPYHDNNFWTEMKEKHPEDWKHACDFDRKLREGHLPNARGKAFIHRSLMPLEEADITPKHKHQIGLFDDFTEECDGLCGV